VEELTQLVARLPLANYSLLRALTAHLILIVQNAGVNKMTMRNVGIVFSPTLGIPAGVFSLMLGEFKRVFGVDQENGESTNELAPPNSGPGPGPPIRLQYDASKRNSRSYHDAAADRLLGLSGRTLQCMCLKSDPLL
jgi:RalA-binding protein 1